MLNERLDNQINIGDRQNVVYVISCLMRGTTSLASLQQLVLSQLGTRVVETTNVVLLLGAMGYLKIEEDSLAPTSLFLSDFTIRSQDKITDVFGRKLINYLLDEKVLSLDNVVYDLATDLYILPASSFKYRHAAYRNLLISFDIIGLRNDSMYDINNALIQYVCKPGLVKKLTQEKLKAILAEEEKMGAEGESFVMEFEKNRVGLSRGKDIKQVSAIDASSGFDIISYENADSKVYDRYIEVKTYKGEPHFHWSRNEKDKASLLRGHYYIYLVDYNRIHQASYKPEMIQDPIKQVFDSPEWNKTIDSYLIEKNIPEELYSDNNNSEEEEWQ